VHVWNLTWNDLAMRVQAQDFPAWRFGSVRTAVS
jgi:hypothetical protein